MTRLELEGIEFAYADGPSVLAGASLAVGAGELVALAGANGSGKSTLLAIAAGLARPAAGRAAVDGRDVAHLAPRLRARTVALVPQGLRRWPEAGVRTFVAGGRYAHQRGLAGMTAEDEAAIDSALEQALVADLAEARLDRISGGQRQRVLVARALAQEAALLLVDEPTAALDPRHQLRVLEVLAGAAAAGAAVLFATHELHLAVQFAERLALIDGGAIVIDAATDTCLESGALEGVLGLTVGRWETTRGELAMPLPQREARPR
ncbi:MAG: ABC transporter ATP-binding protein [Planctomycetota bacterium]